MQDQENPEATEVIKEVVEKDIWGNLIEFWNFVLFPIETGENTVNITIGNILLVIFAFVITSIVLRLIRSFITDKLQETDKLKFISIFKFIKYIVYLVVILVTLSSAGINITIILTASAALFVGIGLALQELFQDVIGGVFIILDKSLLVGDVIEMEGRVGRVFEIKLRTTRALTRDDKVMIIPNHKFMSDVIFNYTQNHKTTRESVSVGVAYGSDTKKVEDILLKCARENKDVMESPEPFVLFDAFGDSSLNFSLHFYVTDSFVDPKIKSLLRFKIDEEFRRNNISIPFPQRDVHFYPNKAYTQNLAKNE
ncbi:mechanosensitive ion channel family protein [Salegentibacter maritimus]|uniref:Mechanosensitive ion channel n=1 Tax=Salegentibacter maritimus TaxID=2794347 RepID=A0ABS0THE1_9FLAO|nr:mechanosensitive ion channel domain-containing protein [Salegentibacter maritimus]MBI6120042.1 mechanosensitive ion channel [Salegentibacter maritimus]